MKRDFFAAITQTEKRHLILILRSSYFSFCKNKEKVLHIILLIKSSSIFELEDLFDLFLSSFTRSFIWCKTKKKTIILISFLLHQQSSFITNCLSDRAFPSLARRPQRVLIGWFSFLFSLESFSSFRPINSSSQIASSTLDQSFFFLLQLFFFIPSLFLLAVQVGKHPFGIVRKLQHLFFSRNFILRKISKDWKAKARIVTSERIRSCKVF